MTKEFEKLFFIAQELSNKIILTEYAHYGKVACALETDKHNIYTGISLSTSSGGECAEISAILAMLKHGESKIIRIVAVAQGEVRTPCGRCREIIRMLNENNSMTMVMIDKNTFKPLTTLLPYAWKY